MADCPSTTRPSGVAEALAWPSDKSLHGACVNEADLCASSLKDNDRFSDRFSDLDAIGSTVVTGPTYTSINDFRAVLAEPATSSGAFR
jgi:glycerate-2-kinase